jgi:RNA polymerase sigma-70 factor (ECF subfamily)
MQAEKVQELFERHGPSLVLYARRWSRWPDDSVQEALIELSQLEEPPIDPVAWLYTTTKRRGLNLTRSEGRRTKYEQLAAAEIDSWFHQTNTTEAFSATELTEQLAALDNDEYELVVGRVWGNLTFSQLADLLECSTSAVHRRYQAALKHLRDALAIESDRDSPLESKYAESKLSRSHDRIPDGQRLLRENLP